MVHHHHSTIPTTEIHPHNPLYIPTTHCMSPKPIIHPQNQLYTPQLIMHPNNPLYILTTHYTYPQQIIHPHNSLCIPTRNRPEWTFGCRTGFCRMSIYYPVSRILPDWNRCSEGEIKGSRKLPEILNLSFLDLCHF